NRSFFQYLQFKLLQVEEVDMRFQPVLKDGHPVLIEPRGLKSYAEQIGKNTGYIIHPDEILADNFAHLVVGAENLPSPDIVAKRRERLLKKGSAECDLRRPFAVRKRTAAQCLVARPTAKLRLEPLVKRPPQRREGNHQQQRGRIARAREILAAIRANEPR